MKPVIEYKQQNGFVNPGVESLAEGWKWVMSLDEIDVNYGIGGFKGADDKNRKFFNELGDITFTILDEDTHYAIRLFLWLKWIHENWEKVEIQAEQAHQIMNFGNLYKDLLELSKPLPLDDGKDVEEVDYKKLNDKKLEEME